MDTPASTENSTPQVPVCRICGVPDPNLSGIGPIAILKDTDYVKLKFLFDGELDIYTCPTNHKTPGLQPTIVIALQSGEAMVVWGTMARGQADAARELGQIHESPVRLTELDTLDGLKDAFAKHAVRLLEEVIEEHNRAQEDMADGHRWERFTADYFTGSALALSSPQVAREIETAEGVTAEDLFSAVVDVQVMTWCAVCDSWNAELGAGRTLEGDLGRYMPTASVIHAAADKFLLLNEDAAELPHVVRFCVEAMRASLLHLRKRTNGRLREWADMVVEQEALRSLAGAEAPPHVVAMELSARRIRETIPYEAMFDASARLLSQQGWMALSVIDALGRKLDYPNFVAQVMLGFRAFLEPGQARVPLDKAVEAIIWAARKHDLGPESIWMSADQMLDVIEEDLTPDTLTRMAEGLCAGFGGKPAARAHAEQWLASKLLARRHVSIVLERLGENPQPWEGLLPAELRARLLVERSNAFRAAGRPADALAAAEAARDLMEVEGATPSGELQRNIAILLSETGRQEEALAALAALLEGADSDLRFRLLGSIAKIYVRLGRPDLAAPHAEEQLEAARGPFSAARPGVITLLASIRSATGRPEEALSLLRETSIDGLSPDALISFASAWINIAGHAELLNPEDRGRLADLVGRLKEEHDASYARRDIQIHLMTVRLLAVLGELTGVSDSGIFWRLLDVGAREFEGAADPLALLGLAKARWLDGDLPAARTHLRELPGAVNARYGFEGSVPLKLDAIGTLRLFSRQLGTLALRDGTWDDVRAVAETQRDLFGRLLARRRGVPETPDLFAEDGGGLRSLGGPCAVLEWLHTEQGLAGLVTVVAANGDVTTDVLDEPGIDLARLAARISHRVSVWHSARQGDPFDLPDWHAFEAYLSRILEGRLAEGGQLVVIEHADIWGLQWHVAAQPRWRTSYVPGWSALGASPGGGTVGPEKRLGVAMVGKFHEMPQVLAALGASRLRAGNLAAKAGLLFNGIEQEACDRTALRELLGHCDWAKVLCHGFIDPTDHQVAFMIASESALPLLDSVSAGTDAGRRHRFGWQECLDLESAPRVVFSAACSSGRAHPAGSGERLGFFYALRAAGTRAFVAPRWDIDPSAVLPILDSAMERNLFDGIPLGEAVHSACLAASKDLPGWSAWALALEGDWR